MSSISIPFCGHILCVTMQSKNTSAHIVQPNTNTIKLFLLFMQFGLCQSESRNARNEQLAHEAHRGPNGAPSIPCRLTTMRSTKFSHPLLYYAPVSSSPHPKLYAGAGALYWRCTTTWTNRTLYKPQMGLPQVCFGDLTIFLRVGTVKYIRFIQQGGNICIPKAI